MTAGSSRASAFPPCTYSGPVAHPFRGKAFHNAEQNRSAKSGDVNGDFGDGLMVAIIGNGSGEAPKPLVGLALIIHSNTFLHAIVPKFTASPVWMPSAGSASIPSLDRITPSTRGALRHFFERPVPSSPNWIDSN